MDPTTTLMRVKMDPINDRDPGKSQDSLGPGKHMAHSCGIGPGPFLPLTALSVSFKSVLLELRALLCCSGEKQAVKESI